MLSALYDQLEAHTPRIDNRRFFKTDSGTYGALDQFSGIAVPALRQYARHHHALSLNDLETLLYHPVNEYRLLALLILVARYRKEKDAVYADFYLRHLDQVNNWNLVDSSCYWILGPHWDAHPESLYPLSTAPSLWHRRIAIVTTWHFIRKKYYGPTCEISKALFNDREDLIHKATGWMLREMGKKDKDRLMHFLSEHSKEMPRTALRYACERLTTEERRAVMSDGL